MRDFQEPTNVEEALARKQRIADATVLFQAKLKDKIPQDDTGVLIVDRFRRNTYRQELKYRLEEHYAETRFLKNWLRLNATRKPSEWEMLGRAYRLLSSLEDNGVSVGDEGEQLLSLLEMHVPHVYLMGESQQKAL